MRSGTLIVARLGSERLPRKHLLPLADARVFDHVVRRVREAAPVTLLCTTTDRSDDELAAAARENGIAVFRGSVENVPARLLLAAREQRLDFVAVVEGDEVFIDAATIAAMLARYGDADYVVTAGFPIGAHLLGMPAATLERICEVIGLGEQNTDGWGRYLTQTGWFRGATMEPDDARLRRPDERLTLDYPEDYELLRAIYERLYRPGGVVALADALELLAVHPELRALNRGRAEEYRVHTRKYPPLKTDEVQTR